MIGNVLIPSLTRVVCNYGEAWSSTSTLGQDVPPQLDADGLDSGRHELPNESTGSRPHALIFTPRESPAKCALESIIPPDGTTDMMVNGGGPTCKEKASMDTSVMASRLLSRGHRVGYVLNDPASILIVRTEAINLYISWELDPSTCSLDHQRVQSLTLD